MSTEIVWTWVPDGKGGRKKGLPILDADGNPVLDKHGKPKIKNGSIHWDKDAGVRHVPHLLGQPLKWRDPRGVFVGSMTDLFHESNMATEDGRRYIAAIFGVMAATPRHTYMLLTKRPHLMREWFEWLGPDHAGRMTAMVDDMTVDGRAPLQLQALTDQGRLVPSWPLPNVWVGTTTEDQQRADERIPELLRVPAAVRFLSVEPMLGPVDVGRWVDRGCVDYDHITGSSTASRPSIDWVIAGGESGPGARPMHPDWVRDVRDQCEEAGVPFLFKQWGAWAPVDNDGTAWTHMVSLDGKVYKPHEYIPIMTAADGVYVKRVGKGKAGRELDGRTWDEFPEAT